jgi:alcohol dehydrogenase
MGHFEFQPKTRLIFGNGTISRLGTLSRELGFRRTLLVADHGLQAVGYVDCALKLLAARHRSDRLPRFRRESG